MDYLATAKNGIFHAFTNFNIHLSNKQKEMQKHFHFQFVTIKDFQTNFVSSC